MRQISEDTGNHGMEAADHATSKQKRKHASAKAKHVRTIPVPTWVSEDIVDDWTTAADVGGGYGFRRLTRTGSVWGERLSATAIRRVVKKAAKRAGIDRLAPRLGFED